MKTIVLATSLLAVAGCSEDATIGIDSPPLTCTSSAAAGMSGSVDYLGETYPFDSASPLLIADPTAAYDTVMISTTEANTQDRKNVRFSFGCGAPDVTSYTVVADASQQLTCPSQVSASVLPTVTDVLAPGPIGTLIVDQARDCLAGRFQLSFHDQLGNGAIDGWFSIPWQ